MKNSNNYRTYKSIDEINLLPLSATDTGPEPAVSNKAIGLSDNIIPQSGENTTDATTKQLKFSQYESAANGDEYYATPK